MTSGRRMAAGVLAAVYALTIASVAHGKTISAARVAGGNKLRVVAAKRTSSGGSSGRVPIGYIGNSGRNGQYYLPSGYKNQPLPIMILLHGAGMSGRMMVQHFSHLADKYRFIIVAPDSRNKLQWASAAKTQKFTSDWYHVQYAYNYIKQLKGVRINYSKVVYAGFSRGGYSAAALASRTKSATHALVIHSSLQNNQIGSHRIPIRISTGTSDPMFTRSRMNKVVSSFKKAKPGWPISLKLYPGGHSLRCPGELESDVKWWLGRL